MDSIYEILENDIIIEKEEIGEENFFSIELEKKKYCLKLY